MPDRITPGELLRAFREYLSVHPDLALSGHAMDNMALDLARIATATQAAQAVPDMVREALEAAQAGLEWYRDRCPEAADGSDDEADELITRALATLPDQDAPTEAPQRYQITSIKYLAGELTLRALGNDLTEHTLDGTPVTHQGVAEVPQTLDAGQVVTLQEIGRG